MLVLCFLFTKIKVLDVFVIFWCSEADEIYKICCVIGSPTNSEWAEGFKLASIINYHFPQVSALSFFQEIGPML